MQNWNSTGAWVTRWLVFHPPRQRPNLMYSKSVHLSFASQDARFFDIWLLIRMKAKPGRLSTSIMLAICNLLFTPC